MATTGWDKYSRHERPKKLFAVRRHTASLRLASETRTISVPHFILRSWRRAKAASDFSRPTPALPWRHGEAERKSSAPTLGRGLFRPGHTPQWCSTSPIRASPEEKSISPSRKDNGYPKAGRSARQVHRR